VRVTAFKKPTPEELAHHFLWRVRRALPGAGMVGVFDRSHYEDVLVPRVHETLPQQEWRQRYDEINAFEAELIAADTTVVKCFLHISYAEQRERLLARLGDPTKHWKFQESDIDERAYWADYQAAFAAMLEHCSTEAAPWYIVPSDRKWYRNWAIGQVLREVLEELDPQYPQTTLDVERLRKRLQPPY
jgi:PPK2 family polyphosphate:nucleotide phosphotransferase